MMSEKKDFRNMKQTQFDRGQVLKGSFSELNSALRTVGTNAVLKDAYTHLSQTIDSNGNPTQVSYFQAIESAIDEIVFVGDVNGSLASSYIKLEDFLTKKTHAFYYVVDGVGVAPNVADIEIPINIGTNDISSIVAFATKNELEMVPEFIVRSQNITSNKISLEYLRFGETEVIKMQDTGFSITRVQEGDSIQVGEVSLGYDTDGNPIYNGNTLKGLLYNPFTASFEIAQSEIDFAPITSSEAEIVNFTLDNNNTEQTIVIPDGTKKFTLQSRDRKANLKIAYVQGESNTNFLSLRKGGNLSEDNLSLIGRNLFIQSDKDNTIVEILIWK